MSYRSILVHLDPGVGCDIRTQAAIRLARRLDCHLVGLAPTGLLDLPGLPGAPLSDLAALAWDSLRDEAERATDRFRDACHGAGLRSIEALVDEAEPAASLIAHAHCSDLTVMTQAEPAVPRMDARRQWLAWHGVAADMRVETTSIDVADAMLSHAADFGADLIVMGAYGHSRWTERVLGGVTRQLIGSATVPLLMSH